MRRKVLLVWLLFIALLLIVGVNDFLFFRIENEYVVALLFLYIVACIFGLAGSNFFEACLITTAIFCISFVLNQFNLIGGGDVKLLVPLILFTENNWLGFVFATAISGSIVSLLYVIFQKQIFNLRKSINEELFKIKKKKFRILNITLLSLYRISKKSISAEKQDIDVWHQEIPYGVALSFGGIFVVLDLIAR